MVSARRSPINQSYNSVDKYCKTFSSRRSCWHNVFQNWATHHFLWQYNWVCR